MTFNSYNCYLTGTVITVLRRNMKLGKLEIKMSITQSNIFKVLDSQDVQLLFE